MLERLFEAYATGNLGKQRVFLRWPDLQNFAEDMKGIMPSEHRLFCRFCPTMECCFDDTLQLQQDLGTRTHKGLTLVVSGVHSKSGKHDGPFNDELFVRDG